MMDGGLLGHAPRDRDELRGWIRCALGLSVPDAARLEGHASPMDYLAHAFFEGPGDGATRDAVVWANRGGGKTMYAALASALDMLFKPGVEVMILAGSLEQASRMHAHLRRFFEADALRPALSREPTRREVRLENGSVSTILAQSERAVRGARPQKLRCDEVELLDPGIWRAAQLVTRSKDCGGLTAHASIEAISTMHRPHGLMSELIGEAREGRRALFRWSLIDTLERCPPSRPCEGCALAPECAGRAKRGGGHVAIGDAVGMKRRTDAASWDAEMLCARPLTTHLVFPEFDRAAHVGAFDPPEGGEPVAGMDFGLRNPTVILFAHASPDGSVHVLDERSRAGALLDEHVRELLESPWGRPAWVGIDPAGRQRSGQTGLSAACVLRRAGLGVRDRRAPLEAGLRAVRARLRPAAGAPTLFIHERCAGLIRAIESYRYPHDRPDDAQPVKDGPDHHADALRYLVVGLDGASAALRSRYL